MNSVNAIASKQILPERRNFESVCQDIRQALKVINAEYQQIDWEDQEFLNRVLFNALKWLEEGRDL